MGLSLTFLVLLAVIAFRQATFGFFSALIMAVLTICCAAAAIGSHDWLATNLFAPYWQPDYAHALALAIAFGVSLLILRLVFDRLVRRSCLLPSMVDRLGGAICGAITALVIVGMMAVAVQMIPFGGSIAGFSRVVPPVAGKDTKGPAEAQEKSELLLTPDRFAAGLGYYVSNGIFSADRPFYRENPDWVQAVGWTNSVTDAVSTYAPPGSITIQGTDKLQTVVRMTPGTDRDKTKATYEPIEPRSGREFRAVRVKLSDAAKDQNKAHIFSLRQFRLVGRGAKGIEQYIPVAIRQDDISDALDRHARYRKEPSGEVAVTDTLYTPHENVAEIVFDLPVGFEPDFLEYKRGARVKVSFKEGGGLPKSEGVERAGTPADSKSPAQGGEKTGSASGEAASTGGSGRRAAPKSGDEPKGGNIRGLTTQSGKSFFGDQLPMEMKQYRGVNAEIEHGKLTRGHLVGEADKQAGGTSEPVSKFDVPDDKRLLQLNVGALQSRSGLGRAISFAVSTVQNYFVETSTGNRFEIAGKYAIAKVGDTNYIEVQYFKERGGSIGGLGQFERIKERDLKGDYMLVLLFLVDPGVQITAFSTGGEATRKDDLSTENLVAPK